MGLHVITEIFESKLNGAYTTTNNHVNDKKTALEMFEMRSNMLLNSANTVKVIKQHYNPDDGYGITKVELDNGCTIEIAYSEFQLI